MATTRIMPLHKGKGRTAGQAISCVIGYVENSEKTDHGRLVTTYQCDSRTADFEFLLAKQQYIQNTGRMRGSDDVIAYHLRQSFAPGEITPDEANRLGQELARRFTKGKNAFLVCTHIDKVHIHNHIIWNAIDLNCERKFRNFWGSTRAVRRLSDTICIENGYSIVEHPKPRGKSYDKWLGDKAKPSNRGQLRDAIDHVLAEKPAGWEALLKRLQEMGYEIKAGKNPSFRKADWGRAVRLDTLGEDYAKDMILAVLKGERTHIPDGRKPARSSEKVNLLVDIQKKLQEGKGAGYERWAKTFNLKQMAQTMNYLTEHGLLEYAALEEKTSSVTGRNRELSDQIKAAEKRMAEIAVLRTHIINYSKTRDVYTAYKRSGYSKKFLAEHEAEIAIHKAAKKAFDKEPDRIPTVKSLQAEYAKLLQEKKENYREYRRLRDEMKELLAVKANVDCLLDQDKRKAGKEKDHFR